MITRTSISRFALTAIALSLGAPSLHAADARPDPALVQYFETKVRPLLAAKCFECHSDQKQKGDLRLDSLDAMLAGGTSGPALVPGDPAKSLIIEAISHANQDLRMPKEKLKAEEIEAITHWVKLGAVWPQEAIGGAAVRPKASKITDEDRAYWAFQPVKPGEAPRVKHQDRVRNAIDAFLLAKLEDKGLTFSPDADKVTLIRRATFDLHGLPPTPAEIEAFVADTSADAYEKLLDRLLDSPRYGERWARHWLDLVRYADSDGFKADDFRPHIWHYRDWVIRAFNSDMPYDRFLTWQLAGDEAAPTEPDAIIATGYLRLGPYEYNQRDVAKQWNEIIDDVTGISGEVFMGLSMHCARCHNHKFDPILQEDYFALRAFFEPLLPDETITVATAEQRAEYDAKLAAWEEATREIRAQIEAIEGPARAAVEKPAIVKYTEDLQRILLAPRETLSPGDQQIKDLAYRQLVYEHKNIPGKIKGEKKTELDKLYVELRKFDAQKPAPLTAVMAVRDVGPDAPPTVIPGDRAKRVIAPASLSIFRREGEAPAEPSLANVSVAKPQAATTGRRLALAQWLTQKDNPLASRVIVNRLWQYHFGTGIVATANDLGHQGEKPTHPELLDWLVSQFVARGWKMKDMHRLMMTSTAYRQAARSHLTPRDETPTNEVNHNSKTSAATSSVNPPSAIRDPQSVDPANRLLWRFPMHRLQAEQLRDALLLVSGEIDGKMFGPGVDQSVPRRSVYLKFMRNNRPELVEAFDGPDAFNSVSRRNVTTIAPQALMLVNGEWTHARARRFAEQVRSEAGGLPDTMIDIAFRKSLGRAPTKAETKATHDFIEQQSKRVAATAPVVKNTEPAKESAAGEGLRGALIDFRKGQRLLMSDANALKFDEFTLEAVFMLRSIAENADVRVIASQWDGNTSNPGWSLGVTGAKSKHVPQTIILQLVGVNEETHKAYDVVVSGLKPQLDRLYHLVVNVKLSEVDSTGITFRLQPLEDGATPQSASVGHTVIKGIENNAAFVIGGRDGKGQASHGWDGILDDVRLYNESLSLQQLVTGRSPKKEAIVGDWRFEPDSLTKDASGKGRDLKNQGVTASTVKPEPAKETKPAAPKGDAKFTAFIDFCHVLLNSNEFLYVD